MSVFRLELMARLTALGLLVLLVASIEGRPQTIPTGAQASPPAQTQTKTPADPLGRTTPRGTVIGFLTAARRGENEVARQYIDTRPNEKNAEDLAHKLFVVLDTRLPARLPQLSDAPEGSRANPLEPDQEQIGTIEGPDGPVDIVLERVTRPKIGQVWLFSTRTLDEIPSVYADIRKERSRLPLPNFLVEWHVGGVRLLDWLLLLLGLTGLYVLTIALNRTLTFVTGQYRRRVRHEALPPGREVLPLPARLLLVALSSRLLLVALPLSLLVRQSLWNITALVNISVLMWLGILLNGVIERHVCRRLSPANYAGGVSLVRVARRLGDVLVVFLAALLLLRRLGINPTPILAGLGVGGIAIALAAQKTLENVIAGASLILDQAVRVGDYLRIGTIEGTVDTIGLRSTRIRTLDRSFVTVPNGQIANMSLETLSARDKFWLHPIVALRYDTRADQMHLVIDGIQTLLSKHPAVDSRSVRVRFLRMGTFSLDVEVSAYVFARDYAQFLEIQEQLLFRVMEIVSRAGAAIAFPSQTMYVNGVNSATR